MTVDLEQLIRQGYPKTRDEWWAWLEYHKDNIRNLVKNYHPVCRNSWHMPITARAAEAVCEAVREEVRKETTDDPLECFDQFYEQKSDGMVSLLEQTWFGIPESLAAHGLPGFGVLCDLCSEAYCLEPGEDEPYV